MNDEKNSSKFWFGMMMGGMIGTSALYFFGTKKGRDKMRQMLDAAENMNAKDIEQLLASTAKKYHNSEKGSSQKVVSDITSVLDKIESSLPSKKEMKKLLGKK